MALVLRRGLDELGRAALAMPLEQYAKQETPAHLDAADGSGPEIGGAAGVGRRARAEELDVGLEDLSFREDRRRRGSRFPLRRGTAARGGEAGQGHHERVSHFGAARYGNVVANVLCGPTLSVQSGSAPGLQTACVGSMLSMCVAGQMFDIDCTSLGGNTCGDFGSGLQCARL